MSSKKILYLTWNMEIEILDDKCLKQISARISRLDPDLIIIGLQEAANYATLETKFIAHKLRKPEYLGKSYKKFHGAHFGGKTKATLSNAYQALQVMARATDKKTVVKATAHQKSVLREKGFCLGVIDFYGKQLCCVSTHLEVKEKERAGDLKNIEKGLEEIRYDSLVLMGDLNYRIKKNAETSEDKLKKELCTVDGRKAIMRHDSFDPKHFNTDYLGPFTWPSYDDNASLPTYKRTKVSKGSAYRAAIEGLAYGGTVDQQKLEKAYFPLKTKKEVFWDLGWLDKVAYSFTKNSGLSLVSEPKMQVWSDVPYGDHAPVALLMEIDGFD